MRQQFAKHNIKTQNQRYTPPSQATLFRLKLSFHSAKRETENILSVFTFLQTFSYPKD